MAGEPSDVSAADSESEVLSVKEETRENGIASVDFKDPEQLDKLKLSQIEALQAKYIASLEERIKSLEQGRRPPPGPSKSNSKPPDRGKIDPFIKRVAADRWNNTKPRRGLLPPDNGTLIVCFKSSTDTESHENTGRPHRLVLNSDYLLSLMAGLSGQQAIFTPFVNVLVYPFKHLILHEAAIRNTLAEVEEKCRKANEKSEKTEEDGLNTDEDRQTSRAEKDPEKEASAKLIQNRDELKCLIEFIDNDMADIFQVRKQIRGGTIKDIAFEYLWYARQLFQPGEMIIANKEISGDQQPHTFIVLHVTGGRTSFDPAGRILPRKNPPIEPEEDVKSIALLISPSKITPFIIDCFYVDFDGQQLGPKSRRIVIPPYTGERPITSLEVYPAKFDPEYSNLMEQLLNRGKKFVSIARGAYKQYSGMSIRENGSRNPFYSRLPPPPGQFRTAIQGTNLRSEEVHGEVMIDQAAGITHFQNSFGLDFRLGGNLLVAPTAADQRETFDAIAAERGDGLVTDSVDDSIVDLDRRAKFCAETDLLEYHDISSPHIPDAQLRLLSDRVYGYALRNRRWLALSVETIRDIVESEAQSLFRTRYEDLVLPRGHKKLLQALVAFSTREQESSVTPLAAPHFTMDVVHSKGEGLIILLHGPPGVGKTSTAECIAAQLNRPLLPITCGDLGRTPRELERNLDEFCGLAHKWRCVLLLDEADVFLSRREKGDIDRNARIAVFLRTLEYYAGVLVLTSNRVGEIDEAFRSRIHICLFYPKLDQASVAKVWEKNINRIKTSKIGIDIEEEEIRHFYQLLWLQNEKNPSRHWNGRQIKNAFQTAVALAYWDFHCLPADSRPEKPVLRAKHFRRVGETSAHFDDYIGSVYGIEEQDAYSVLAAREEVRRDIAPPTSFPTSRESRSLFGALGKKKPRQRTWQPASDGSDSDGTGFEMSKPYEFAQDDDDEDDTHDAEYQQELLKLKQKYKFNSRIV